MASKTTRIAFRASNISEITTVEHLKAAISKEFTSDENATIEIKISLAPSCTDGNNTQTAIIQFKPKVPDFLSRLDHERGYQIEVHDMDIEIDQDFYGLTQLFPTDEGKIALDIVAITGLNGHAYGSWMGGKLGKMWLRDFLPKDKDLRNCRTMIFGYNSKLRAKSIHTVRDYCRDLLIDLRKARRSQEERERPIIFIGHSFGGIIVAQSLVRASQPNGDLGDQSLVKATYAVLFFGVPHRGLFIEDVISMVKEESQQQRIPLLEEINRASQLITSELESFINLAVDLKILSFYETGQTRKVIKGADGSYGRFGDYTNIVNEDSALLNLPRSIEERIPVEGDHSNMVKFRTSGDRTYVTVRDRLCEWARSAPDELSKRFKLDISDASRSVQDRKNQQALNRFIQVIFPHQTLVQVASQALIVAADAGLLPAVRQLLERAVNPNSRNQIERQYTWQHYDDSCEAAAPPDSWLRQETQSISIRSGETALARAAKRGYEAVVQLLLRYGANPNLGTMDMQMPLHEASLGGHTAIMKLLLENGADPRAMLALWGTTALHMAARGGHGGAVLLLLEKGAAPNARQLSTGNTPLHVAVSSGHVGIAQTLLVGGAKVMVQNGNGRTALHEAAKEGHDAAVRWLLEKGHIPDTCDKYCATPLHDAALAGHSTVVWLLLERGADPQARLKSGKTAMDLATEGGHNAVIQLLKCRLGSEDENWR